MNIVFAGAYKEVMGWWSATLKSQLDKDDRTWFGRCKAGRRNDNREKNQIACLNFKSNYILQIFSIYYGLFTQTKCTFSSQSSVAIILHLTPE